MTSPTAAGQETIVGRVLRGSAWLAFGTASAQGIRLLANLVLTRLLFPEAFGLMALVTAFIVGMTMFSDVGLLPWIQQNKKGDDPVHLDTAWTIQVFRGVALWIITLALASPTASFFNEPMLAMILPIAGLELLIAGFTPTRASTAFRHLELSRLTLFKLASQIIGVTAMIILAWKLQSVWALVIGGLTGSMTLVLLIHFGLNGHKNSFHWNWAAAKEIVRFGKWIFLSTIFGFVVAQGDKLILGKLLPTEALGIYNIGYFLASFPVLLAETITRKVLIPLYRDRPPRVSRENFLAIRHLRLYLTTGIFVFLAGLSLFGDSLVSFLYDPRYEQSGVILVLVACAQMPMAIGLTYTQAALANGNSRQFFTVVAVKAVLMLGLIILGTKYLGVVGAVGGQALAHALTLPSIILLARAEGAWDGLHDMIYLLATAVIATVALLLHADAIAALM